MPSKRFWLRLIGIAAMAILMSGCNLFDGVDTSLSRKNNSDLASEGEIALRSGNYILALDIFQRLSNSPDANEAKVIQGLGESIAGMAGFKLTRVMDVLQNGTGGYEHTPVTLKTAATISDPQSLGKAVGILWKNPAPDRPDLIARGLMGLTTAARLLLDKYDTNRNGKLDSADQINFETNDKTTLPWPDLYREIVTGPSSTTGTLEQSYKDLANGFNGRGEPWTFFTPVEEKKLVGTYTAINKSTILAVGELVDRIEAVNPYYNVHLASFTAAIIEIDGTD